MPWLMVTLFIVIGLDVDWDRSGHWPSIISWLPWEAGLYGQSLGGREAKGRGRGLQPRTGSLHVVTMSGWNAGGTTLDPGSWRLPMLRAGKTGSPWDPDTLSLWSLAGIHQFS